jgi:hypothetical protein
MVVVVKRDRGSKKGNASKATDDKRQPITYVYLASGKAVFLVTGEPRESKYSYGVPIIPLYGKYRAKDGKVYDAEELRGKRVVLNVDKNDGLIDEIRKRVKLVAIGYAEDEVLAVEDGGEDG